MNNKPFKDGAMVVGVGKEVLDIPNLKAFDIISEEIDPETGRFVNVLDAILIAHFNLRIIELFDEAKRYAGGEVILNKKMSRALTHWPRMKGKKAFHQAVIELIKSAQNSRQIRSAA